MNRRNPSMLDERVREWRLVFNHNGKHKGCALDIMNIHWKRAALVTCTSCSLLYQIVRNHVASVSVSCLFTQTSLSRHLERFSSRFQTSVNSYLDLSPIFHPCIGCYLSLLLHSGHRAKLSPPSFLPQSPLKSGWWGTGSSDLTLERSRSMTRRKQKRQHSFHLSKSLIQIPPYTLCLLVIRNDFIWNEIVRNLS